MTMPHLMNCAHMADGWCLDCVIQLHDYADALNARCVADTPDAERWRKLRDTPATSVAPGPLRGWLFSRPGGADSLDRMADALPPLVLPNVVLSGARTGLDGA